MKELERYGAMMGKAFKLEDRDIGWWFNPILVVEDDSGNERLFGLTEIDVDGVSIAAKNPDTARRKR